MQISRQQSSWRLFVRAKANHFTLRFKAAGSGFSFGPHWTLRRFSFILKFRKFFLFRLNSQLPLSRPCLIRARVLHVIHKFQSPFTRSTSGYGGWIHEQAKDLTLSGSWVLLAFLLQLQHIWKKYGKAVFVFTFIIILACVGFLGVLWMNKGKRTKPVKVRGLRNCMAIIAASSLFFTLGGYWDRMGIMCWDLIS